MSDVGARVPRTTMPDRLCIDPASPFYNAALINRGVAVRFKGTEKKNVYEYCISEHWVKVMPGVGRGRDGKSLKIKLQGAVHVWMRDEGEPQWNGGFIAQGVVETIYGVTPGEPFESYPKG